MSIADHNDNALGDTLAEREALETNGFVILNQVVSLSDLSELKKHIIHYFNRISVLPDKFRKELGANVGGATELNDVINLVPFLYCSSILHSVVQRCSTILGCSVCITYANAILKPAHTGDLVKPHQDSAYDRNNGLTEKYYTVWLPFIAANAHYGSLYYVPGSHLQGPVSHKQQYGVQSVTIDPETKLVTAEVPLGGISLHSALTIHGSHPNRSNFTRLALSLRLRADRC